MKKILIYILALFSFSAIYSQSGMPVAIDRYWGSRVCKQTGKMLTDMWGVDSVVRFLIEKKNMSVFNYCDSLGYADSVSRIIMPRIYELKGVLNDYFAKHKVRCEKGIADITWNNKFTGNPYLEDIERNITIDNNFFKKNGYDIGQLCFPGELSQPYVAEDDGYEELSNLERVLIRLDIPLDSINLEGINVDSVKLYPY